MPKFKYAESYIDEKGNIFHVKKNQIFPDRAIWISSENRWEYFKWDNKKERMRKIPFKRVHASQLDGVVPYYGSSMGEQ